MRLEVIGPLNPPFAWDGCALYDDLGPDRPVPHGLRGAAASAEVTGDGRWRLLRDPLGLDKLFWAQDDDGAVTVAATPRRLIDAGAAFADVRALPRGLVVDLDPADDEPRPHSIVPAAWATPSDASTVDAIGGSIRATLDRYLAAVAAASPGARAFVCLSGGLDSSGVLALARPHFPELVAVSFDLARPGGRASEDRLVAERLARDLAVPLLAVTVSADQLLDHLDTVLVEGVDWRDFNVHAGLVNAALAEAIAVEAPARRLVLTGDLANEFLADYHPEQYRDRTYYALPRLRPEALRASLVRGLDTSHREIGVFGAWHLPVVQPYAAAVDDYLALPAQFLVEEGHKQRLCRSILRTDLPEYIYQRRKTRAQVGDPEAGGTLAACVDRGVDGPELRRRFARLHDVDDPRNLDRFLRAGLYRSAVPAPSHEKAHL